MEADVWMHRLTWLQRSWLGGDYRLELCTGRKWPASARPSPLRSWKYRPVPVNRNLARHGLACQCCWFWCFWQFTFLVIETNVHDTTAISTKYSTRPRHRCSIGMHFDFCNLDLYLVAAELNRCLISLSPCSNICVRNVTEIVQIVFKILWSQKPAWTYARHMTYI